MKLLKIMIFFLLVGINAYSIESVDKGVSKAKESLGKGVDKAREGVGKTKDKAKNILKTLSRKSLDKEGTLEFIAEHVIALDDNKGDGIVTYYFQDNNYIRYKDLKKITEDTWKISKLGKLKLQDNGNEFIWKIQPSKINTINIKKKFGMMGKLHEFTYQSKTDFYLMLEEEKLKN